MVLQNDVDLLNPPAELEKRKHKLKRLVQSPNSFFMDVKCQGCFNITTVFSHSQTVVVCGNCQTVLCQPTGGRARLTEGCSFRRKGLLDLVLCLDLPEIEFRSLATCLVNQTLWDYSSTKGPHNSIPHLLPGGSIGFFELLIVLVSWVERIVGLVILVCCVRAGGLQFWNSCGKQKQQNGRTGSYLIPGVDHLPINLISSPSLYSYPFSIGHITSSLFVIRVWFLLEFRIRDDRSLSVIIIRSYIRFVITYTRV
ncbi:hypothetical protein CRG98_027087 [Punica granatum]|uniref:40S ribosomal protein S27 n=1 Tax=Punica granatum TaxID=22663 RepID=A0A2I0J8F5_PUNGR|nr:hypothetical protein CRG98_027087 [Punica granatum]